MKHAGIVDGLGRTVIVEESQAIFDAIYAPRGWVTATQGEADAFFGAPEPDDSLVTTAQLNAALAGSVGSSVASVQLSPLESITYNGDGTVATVTDTATGAVFTYTYNGDGTPATESKLLSGVTTTRTFTYTSGNLTSVA